MATLPIIPAFFTNSWSRNAFRLSSEYGGLSFSMFDK